MSVMPIGPPFPTGQYFWGCLLCPIEEGLFFVRSSVLEMPIDKLSFGSSNCCYIAKPGLRYQIQGNRGGTKSILLFFFFNFFSLKRSKFDIEIDLFSELWEFWKPFLQVFLFHSLIRRTVHFSDCLKKMTHWHDQLSALYVATKLASIILTRIQCKKSHLCVKQHNTRGSS